MLHAMIATVTNIAEANRSKESADKIYMGLELEAAITASFITMLPSVLVRNMKEVTGGAYKCWVVYLKKYSLWSPHGPEGLYGLKAIIRDGV